MANSTAASPVLGLLLFDSLGWKHLTTAMHFQIIRDVANAKVLA